MKQELKEQDFEARKTFCNFVLTELENDANFTHRIIVSDEANVHVNGHVNLHNAFFYGEENPNVVIPKTVNSPSIGVFAACGHRGLVCFRTYGQ